MRFAGNNPKAQVAQIETTTCKIDLPSNPIRYGDSKTSPDSNSKHLSDWTRPDCLEKKIGKDALDKILSRLPNDIKNSVTIFYSYENYYAKSGGLGTVIQWYPSALNQVTSGAVVVAPLHRIVIQKKSKWAELEKATQERFKFYIDYENTEQLVEVRKVIVGQGKNQHTEYLFDIPEVAKSKHPYFTADLDPYNYSNEPVTQKGKSESLLVRDTLLAARIASKLINELELAPEIIVHANDWQGSLILPMLKEQVLNDKLTYKDQNLLVATHLQMHNAFDQHISASTIKALLGYELFSGNVVNECSIYADGPIMTVSDGYAKGLFEDPIVKVFSAHQIERYSAQGVLGISHGMFKDLPDPFPEINISHSSLPYYEKKLEMRAEMLDALEEQQKIYDDTEVRWGKLTADGGRPISSLSDDIPVFLIAGRYDPSQKGFDMLVSAIKMLSLNEPIGLKAKFVMLQMSNGVQSCLLKDCKETAELLIPNDIVVFPYGLTGKPFEKIMAGATYLIMPSNFEPFGMANEAHACGTPVIANDTGGLSEQVIDWHANPNNANGLLFRAKLNHFLCTHPKILAEIATEMINQPTVLRNLNLLYNSMMYAAADGIKQGIDIYKNKLEIYDQILKNCYPSTRRYSWSKTGQSFGSVYSLGVNKNPHNFN